jgi:hypothetical protein
LEAVSVAAVVSMAVAFMEAVSTEAGAAVVTDGEVGATVGEVEGSD